MEEAALGILKLALEPLNKCIEPNTSKHSRG